MCQWNTLDQLTWSVGFLQQGLKRCHLDLGTSPLGKHIFWPLGLVKQISRVVPAWVSFEITTYLGLRSLTGRQSSMDIDMIRVIRRDPRNPIALVLPPGSLQTRRMAPRRGARRGGGRAGRGADRGQPEEQPAVPTVDANAPVTQMNLAAMEQHYQDMLQAALARFLAAQ
ncbi:hypothetical protein E5676_scaffold143G001290 [Cucumis melo var. makuwa]|uniref:Gag protease polyprotein n=1 Tax=Cucumis melo var. makuwa TaxID=1194695 RepID=A0A5D3C163_CUCMM|nr:hypothetical protein E5676_scaffold143G001290 [Cucumis melo var. makuwa]